jgi:hypothetical protein
VKLKYHGKKHTWEAMFKRRFFFSLFSFLGILNYKLLDQAGRKDFEALMYFSSLGADIVILKVYQLIDQLYCILNAEVV